MDVTVAVLAGGLGTRIGGNKALVELHGRPLISYALQTAEDAGLNAVVVAKSITKLPPLDVPVYLEPEAPTHPLQGVITALEKLPAVIALPCDMPFVKPSQLNALALMADDLALLWRNQPFPSLYRRSVLPQLRAALEANQSMRAAQAQSDLAPAMVSSTDSAPQLLSINTAEDLARAETRLRAD
jgi:molybdopterin-guanine dinucleotide biosynthesis protein A